MFGYDPENKTIMAPQVLETILKDIKSILLNFKIILEIQAIILEKIRIYSEKLHEMDSVPNLFKIF